MNPQLPALGALCVSLAGHDTGRTYIIVKVIDHEFVEVADGTVRSIKTPKKKRVKHIKITKALPDNDLIAKIAEGGLKDNELHKYILEKNRAAQIPGGVPCQEKTV